MVPQQHVWELHTDGASSEEGTGAGLVLTSPDGEEHTYALKFCFYASNNEAEYEALVSDLRIALEMGITNLKAYVDSQIVAQQVNGTFDARDTSMRYLYDGGLPIDKAEARRIRVTAPMYEVINGALYGKSYNGPLLRCLTNDESLKVVKEMHEGVCPQHSGFQIIKTCEKCQRHGIVKRLPKYYLIPVSSAWPFCKWAIDIVEPFNRSTGNAKFMVVAIDFFTKWVEAKALAKITGENVKKFVWHDIVCRYGAPNEIAHRTTPKWSTGETPFSLVYGTEAVIPAEICVPTQRIMAFDIEANSDALRENLNLLEERRLMAAIRQADHKHKMAKYYNKKVKHTQFEVGDLVLRDNEASRQIKFRKLAPKWEGPYKVTSGGARILAGWCHKITSKCLNSQKVLTNFD
ncbi:uncharacterized protein [Rutidosis leptorrhynchoides]|uniref:uncharacterized protein n=1 Tax=Rutidosis leptorrhynchoides TaxID=125765 RepID=UPI003A999144